MINFVARSMSYNPAGKFLLLFVNPDVNRKSGPAIALQFFKLMLEKFSAANVIFCFGHGVSKYDIYTTDPYNNPEECGIFIFFLQVR